MEGGSSRSDTDSALQKRSTFLVLYLFSKRCTTCFFVLLGQLLDYGKTLTQEDSEEGPAGVVHVLNLHLMGAEVNKRLEVVIGSDFEVWQPHQSLQAHAPQARPVIANHTHVTHCNKRIALLITYRPSLSLCVASRAKLKDTVPRTRRKGKSEIIREGGES
jgi:hypothetical protein